jgi:hypothetical protein
MGLIGFIFFLPEWTSRWSLLSSRLKTGLQALADLFYILHIRNFPLWLCSLGQGGLGYYSTYPILRLCDGTVYRMWRARIAFLSTAALSVRLTKARLAQLQSKDRWS